MVDELMFKREKNGQWSCTDKYGHSAMGFSKEHAKSQYMLYYKDITPQIFDNDCRLKVEE